LTACGCSIAQGAEIDGGGRSTSTLAAAAVGGVKAAAEDSINGSNLTESIEFDGMRCRASGGDGSGRRNEGGSGGGLRVAGGRL